MTVTVESALAIVVGATLIFGYVCRLAKSSWWTVRAIPLLFHLSGGLQCIGLAVWAAKHGSLGVGWIGYLFAGLWLVWSYYSWAGPVPRHARRLEKVPYRGHVPPRPFGSG